MRNNILNGIESTIVESPAAERLKDVNPSEHLNDVNLIDVTPNPRLLESLRDMGYDNYQAIKDIVDNSGDALIGSSTKNPFIKIITKISAEGKGRIIVIDNGKGMTRETLNEAVKLGSNTKKERDGELGYFGVGLKGAAISMGRAIRIITKHADDKYLCGVFDLDKAVTEKCWKFVSLEEADADQIKYFNELTNRSSTGTVVEIYKLDRISNRSKVSFDGILLKSIAKTYRFLISENNKDGKISFYLNNKKITPIDPMGRDLKGTLILNNKIENQKYQFNVDGQMVEIIVQYFYVDSGLETVYPSEKLNGKSNGFYVMRNHRQIMEAERFDFIGIDKYSGWLRSFRAELSFDGKYDEVLKTNVMKTRIILPQSLTDIMQKDVSEYVKYCKNEQKKLNPESIEDVSDDVKKDTESIVKKMNEKKTVPTILTDKKGNPIKKVELDKEPEVKDNDDKRNRKKEINKRKKKTFNKIEVDYVHYGEDASFFVALFQGNGKFLIRINCDHGFYSEFERLERQGKNFIISLLHSFALASHTEIYSEDLNQIDELVRTWSNFLRRDLLEKE